MCIRDRSMVCTQIMGLEYAVSIANSSGTLQMNEYKPLIGFNILTSLKLLKDAENAIIMSLNELYFLPLGGTAVGTGINCPKGFCEESIKSISDDTNLMFYKSKNNFSIMASHDRLAQVMSQIKILAGALFKISNDIKILSSGPRSGIYELIIPQNEPGSSIMPGKVNPTQ